jgi:hypothetical protein
LVERGGRVLLVKRTGPPLDGLWEPPGVELGGREPASRALARALARLGVRGALTATPVPIRHKIMNYSILVEVWSCQPRSPLPRARAGLRWVARGNRELALSSLARRALALDLS